jgi:hypothetical protein
VSDGFPAQLLEALRAARTVRIRTRRASEDARRETIIWLVVDDEDRVLVRSVRGARGRWFRDLRSQPMGVLIVGGAQVEVRAEPAADAERVDACSRALSEKYARSGASLASMLVPEVLEATMELQPA